MNHTIAAISTPIGTGGLGVVRISGPEARAIAARIFRPVSEKPVEQMAGYTCLYGHVYQNDQPLDEAVCTCFAAPKSYTGEDVMELSCHGGAYILSALLEAAFAAGAVPAGPGEFTRRAMENGKMSLTQAEAVMDLIGAQGQMAARAALAAREGALFQSLQPVKEQLLALNAHLTALIDFPEEDLPELAPDAIAAGLRAARDTVAGLLDRGNAGRLLQQGVNCAIVGRPNVGKSSLMNLLSGRRRSIVTPVPGTTRDVVEELISLDGLLLRLADTAGIRETGDLVEQEGVNIAKERLQSADLVLAVFDLSAPLDPGDRQVLALTGLDGDVSRETFAAPLVLVWNKSDLPPHPELLALKERHPGVTVSAQSGDGAEALWEAIRAALQLNHIDPAAPLLANQRQQDCARRALASLEEAAEAFAAGWTLDAVSVAAEEALQAIMELTGERASAETIDRIFETFCVGK